MPKEMIRIMLVDDHKIVRESWKLLLESHPLFHVIAESDNGQHAISKAIELQPDVMLVDVNMSPLNGFNVTESVAKAAPNVKVIGLSVNNQPKYATKMLELGAKGYLTKTSPLEEINHGILEVHGGAIYICNEVKSKMNPDR